MVATSGWAVEQAQRRIDGLATDGLSWSEFGAAVIGVLADIVPHDAACVATVDPNSGLFTSLVRSEIDESEDELFMEIELTQPDPITLTTLAATAAGVGILGDHLGGDPRSNPRCRDLLGPHFDLEHELRGVARVRGRMWGATALYRAPTRPGFTPDEAAALAALEGAMARGVQRCALTEANGAIDTAPAIIGPVDGPAVIVVDEHGHLRQATEAGEARLAGLGPYRPDRLPTAVRHTAAAARNNHAGERAMVQARLVTGEWVVVRAGPFVSGLDDGWIAVTIEPADVTSMLPMLIDAHGLTEREGEVVQSVVAGASTTEIAAGLGISAYTVQDHLKAVFRKVGVVSRRQLVASLTRQGPTPPRP